eukprot:scaffold11584_cov34-Cyclotella_meneghiniana.AAC.1
MSGLFRYTAFNEPINGWDVSRIENMNYMFRGATQFNQDLSGWKTDRVRNMGYMFYGATSFNQNLNSWNTGTVTDMQYMFYRATAFNMNIGSWDVSTVTNMGSMFRGATKFNQGLNNWDVSRVVSMSYMFMYASEFNGDISNWSVSNVTSMKSMFADAKKFNRDISGWRATSCNSYSAMFAGADIFNRDLSQWHTTNYSAGKAVDGHDGTFSQTQKDMGSSWMVDLESDIDVQRIAVINRSNEDYWKRLSKTNVTLLDEDDNILWYYYIDDGDKSRIDIDVPSTAIYRHFCKIEKCPDTTSQVRINQQEGDDNDATPFQLDEREDPKKLSSSSIVNPSQESNSMEIENSHDYDSPTFLSDEEMQNWQPQEPPHHTERDSLSSLSSS